MKIKLKIAAAFLISIISLAACAAQTNGGNAQNSLSDTNAKNSGAENDSMSNSPQKPPDVPANRNAGQPDGPTTPREFFMVLPEKYFRLEAAGKSKNIRRAKEEFLRTRVEVEDNKNGFLRAFADGAQPGIVIALFKYPAGDYLIGVEIIGEGENANYFLGYGDGNWADVGAELVPDFGADKYYVLPRLGTTVEVYKRRPEQEAGAGEQGAKLYNLVWKNGAFSIQK